ncbi:GNAT family N-acetyltransferase [Amycolatopsis thailandensis]|uniref:GNAT family N-acetyltransferase n=1 Tax=Amycolatopsis thailandensis TaxID=589330 RepID=A0A229RVP2_9PSEU|nr:GNAT family N-acetyltransferase [Amycolatopsis thailandensis]OXM50549.1 GNAT family N-acetyltransferase [Amycolatopsis thailandensis]
MSVEITSGEDRYDIAVDGKPAGLLETRTRPDAILFLHTEISDDFAGQGLAGKLVKAALDDVRSQGRSVLPYCPYVRSYIAKHREYEDLVPEDKRAEFEL